MAEDERTIRAGDGRMSRRFGWWGGFGTAFWCDPATDTVAALFTQRMIGGPDDTELPDRFLAAAFAPE